MRSRFYWACVLVTFALVLARGPWYGDNANEAMDPERPPFGGWSSQCNLNPQVYSTSPGSWMCIALNQQSEMRVRHGCWVVARLVLEMSTPIVTISLSNCVH